MSYKFTSKTDAQTWFENTGYNDWYWFNGFSREDLITFIWQYADQYRNAEGKLNDRNLIAAYLRAVNENPASYGL